MCRALQSSDIGICNIETVFESPLTLDSPNKNFSLQGDLVPSSRLTTLHEQNDKNDTKRLKMTVCPHVQLHYHNKRYLQRPSLYRVNFQPF